MLVVKLAVVALVATPALAQPPGNRPAQPGTLPLPPGYRPRTPPPQAQPQRQPDAPGSLSGRSGFGGQIMYFQKPADATTATGAETATEMVTPVAANHVPDVPPPVPTPALLPPPPPPSRYLPPAPAVAAPELLPVPAPGPVAAPVVYQPKPGEMPPAKDDGFVVQKKDFKIPPVDPQYIQLPPREHIFMAYNDLELEKAITERVRQDLKAIKKYDPTQAEKYLVFPSLPLVSPPGVPYVAKTASYPPSKVLVEPCYVVHRRLHFEEKNSERYGWDLGPLSTVVSAGYFYRDLMLWPQSLASGCVHGFWSTSAGKCLPGSPVPYYLYPVGLTVTGTAAETLAVTTAAFIFP